MSCGCHWTHDAIFKQLLLIIDFFWLSEGYYDSVGKAEDQRPADKDNKIGGEEDHDKDKRIIAVIGRYKQLDTVIEEKGSN